MIAFSAQAPVDLSNWDLVLISLCVLINAALTAAPRFAIVDGIVGMEGNGPIQGDPRHSGVLVFGADPVAVDATCCRLMGIAPARVGYLAEASLFLGNLEAARIEQRGEDPAPLSRPYRLFKGFEDLRADPASEAAGS